MKGEIATQFAFDVPFIDSQVPQLLKKQKIIFVQEARYAHDVEPGEGIPPTTMIYTGIAPLGKIQEVRNELAQSHPHLHPGRPAKDMYPYQRDERQNKEYFKNAVNEYVFSAFSENYLSLIGEYETTIFDS